MPTPELSLERVTSRLLVRYWQMLARGRPDPANHLPEDLQKRHLIWMCITALENLEGWPEDKSQRWLGFVQCGVIAHGLTTTRAERDHTRSAMHEVYRSRGLRVPVTVDRMGEK